MGNGKKGKNKGRSERNGIIIGMDLGMLKDKMEGRKKKKEKTNGRGKYEAIIYKGRHERTQTIETGGLHTKVIPECYNYYIIMSVNFVKLRRWSFPSG